jgi:uncharacterized protein (UPF0335 family)
VVHRLPLALRRQNPRAPVARRRSGNGFDVKALREVIRIREQDPDKRDEQESLLDAYLQAINFRSSVPKAA